MHAIHKEPGIKANKGRKKTGSKVAAPRFTESVALTALQGKIPLPGKHEEAKAFFRDVQG
jgi:hypothetical protein